MAYAQSVCPVFLKRTESIDLMNPHSFPPFTLRHLSSMLGIVAVLTASTQLAQADADYHSIVVLNPFRLKPVLPPKPMAMVSQPPQAPLAAVELTGITDVLAVRKACLEIVPAPGKALLRPVLGEGERSDSVEVISIDIVRNEVIIRNGPVTTNLTFKVAKASSSSVLPIPTVPPLPALDRPVARARQVIVTGGPTTTPNLTAGAVAVAAGAGERLSSGSQAVAPTLSPVAAVIDLEKKRQGRPALPYPPTLLSPRAPIRPPSGHR